MSRKLTVAVAQMGPIARAETRAEVVERKLAMLHRAKAMGAETLVFPELALTTFFPRWYFEDEAELDTFYEHQMPNAATAPLFEAARKLGMGFCIGYAELLEDAGRKRRFNTAIYVAPNGDIVGKYRKVHLPGHAEHEPWRAFQHLEKRYFEPGDLGFPVFRAQDGIFGMCICNDRRWPETWRVMGLQGVELVMLGYNTPLHNPPVPQHDPLSNFHNALSIQAGAYQNGTFAAAAAKAGREEGCDLIGQSMIVAPTGEIVAQATTLADEVIVATCDLGSCALIKDHIFKFAAHRQPQHYGLIVERKGAILPD
jgi:N-carbamoyl-D-amino-acid hydrolase